MAADAAAAAVHAPTRQSPAGAAASGGFTLHPTPQSMAQMARQCWFAGPGGGRPAPVGSKDGTGPAQDSATWSRYQLSRKSNPVFMST